MAEQTQQPGKLPALVILARNCVIGESWQHEPLDAVTDPVAPGGTLEAIARLNHAGITVTVVGNLSALSDGTISVERCNELHAGFFRQLARVGGHVDGIFFCPHGHGEGCACHLPAPGLLHAIALRFATSLADVPFISHSHTDLEAAIAVHARPVWLRGKVQVGSLNPALAGLAGCEDLSAAVDQLLLQQPLAR